MASFPVRNNTGLQNANTNVHQLQVALAVKEKATSDKLSNSLYKIPGVAVKAVLNDFSSVFYWQKNNTADVLFTDVTLLHSEQIKEVKNIAPATEIIAVAPSKDAHESVLAETVFGFIYQPFLFEDVFARMYLLQSYYAAKSNLQQERNSVFVKTEYRLVKIQLNEILFIAGLKDYVQVYTKGKSAPVITLMNLKEFEKKLPHKKFMRVHRSYIVNLDHIDSIARNEISVATFQIPLGDAFKKVFGGYVEQLL